MEEMMRLFRTPIAIAVMVVAGWWHSLVLADEELRLPEDKTICSPSGVYCAGMSVIDRRTTVFKHGRPSWSMDRWFPDAYLADDGDHLIVGHGGLGLVPVRFHPSTTILTFWRRGELVRKVPLTEIVEDLSRLPLTGGHRRWGRTLGFDDQGRFLVQTVEDRVLAFDVKDGSLVDTWPSPRHRN
ncbi:hypothetical protein [Pelagibius sp.]|uniref:hypothetical protein n=1 Tax=Pelagibius sp. TaxID=1931238 RepID=UPI003B50D38F